MITLGAFPFVIMEARLSEGVKIMESALSGWVLLVEACVIFDTPQLAFCNLICFPEKFIRSGPVTP